MASPNARSGWLSTRNKTKITPKQPTLRKRGSLTKFKASTSSFLLTQNSPPAQQLLSATRQTTVTHFFKQASEGTLDDMVDYQPDMENMNSDNSIAKGNEVKKLHNITDPDDDLTTEKGDDSCKHADLVNHSSHSCGFSDGPGMELFEDSEKEILTSLCNETAYSDCYSSTLNDIRNLDASVDEDTKKHKIDSSKSINSTDTNITSYKENHTHVEQCRNDPTVVSHGQYNNLVLNAGTDQNVGQFSRKRRLSDHDRYDQACMTNEELSGMVGKRHKTHHPPASRMVSAMTAQYSTERIDSVDDQSESPISQKDIVKQSVCSVEQSGSQSSHENTICSVDDHSECLISAEHQEAAEDSINFSLESGLEFNVDGDSEFTLRSQRMKFDRLETRVKEMAGNFLEDTLTLGLDSQFY